MNCPVLVHHFPVFGRTATRHHLRTAQNVHTRAEFQKKKKALHLLLGYQKRDIFK